jgi:hypothetical protein
MLIVVVSKFAKERGRGKFGIDNAYIPKTTNRSPGFLGF